MKIELRLCLEMGLRGFGLNDQLGRCHAIVSDYYLKAHQARAHCKYYCLEFLAIRSADRIKNRFYFGIFVRYKRDETLHLFVERTGLKVVSQCIADAVKALGCIPNPRLQRAVLCHCLNEANDLVALEASASIAFERIRVRK